ncbi:MAG: DUF805 domain-containing protein [Minisyncoccota bacterium]
MLTTSGRISRRNFGLGFLLVVSVLFSVYVLLVKFSPSADATTWVPFLVFAVIYLFGCFLLLSFIVRRLHDFGKSGLIALLYFVPIVNLLLLYVLLVKKGDESDNKFGISTKMQIFWPTFFGRS